VNELANYPEENGFDPLKLVKGDISIEDTIFNQPIRVVRKKKTSRA